MTALNVLLYLASSLFWLTCFASEHQNCKFALLPPSRVVMVALAQEANGQNASNGVSFPIKIVRLHARFQELYLHELRPVFLSPEAKVELFVTLQNGERLRVRLPSPMGERLVSYLKNGGAPSSPFDCNCFAHYINGIEYEFGLFSDKQWSVHRFTSESDLAVGSTIIIGHDINTITHLAIYLGHSLYLSKFGTSGPLIVSSLEAMKIGFGGNEVFVAAPL